MANTNDGSFPITNHLDEWLNRSPTTVHRSPEELHRLSVQRTIELYAFLPDPSFSGVRDGMIKFWRSQTPSPPIEQPETVRGILANLRTKVKESQLTYREIGERIGWSESVSRANLSRILSETDSPEGIRLSTILQITSALGISLHDI